MQYFETFPKMVYDVHGTGDYKLVTDILRRFKVRKDVQNEIVFFDKYEVKDGEKPEDVSYKFYGAVDYHWVVLSINNPDAIHHYEVAQSSGKTTSLDYSHLIQVNSDATGATSVSNREYEDRINENKRLIKILKPVYLDEYVEEFRRLIQR